MRVKSMAPLGTLGALYRFGVNQDVALIVHNSVAVQTVKRIGPRSIPVSGTYSRNVINVRISCHAENGMENQITIVVE
jgi:hypothetical protein